MVAGRVAPAGVAPGAPPLQATAAPTSPKTRARGARSCWSAVGSSCWPATAGEGTTRLKQHRRQHKMHLAWPRRTAACRPTAPQLPAPACAADSTLGFPVLPCWTGPSAVSSTVLSLQPGPLPCPFIPGCPLSVCRRGSCLQARPLKRRLPSCARQGKGAGCCSQRPPAEQSVCIHVPNSAALKLDAPNRSERCSQPALLIPGLVGIGSLPACRAR